MLMSDKVDKRYLYLLLATVFMISGCQPKVYLMPPPVGIKTSEIFFDLTKDNKDGNLLYTLFATNRLPFERPSGATGYTIFPSDILKLGYVVHSVGDDDMSWDELHRQSLEEKRDRDLLIKQTYVRERASYHDQADLSRKSSRGEGFFKQINDILERSFSKDILLYVHGANSNFYRATAQGAQIYHFTGHNSLVLTFSWPSAENILKYKTDVLHAANTVPAFARLIEILANHTNAKNLNIVAYSAGAQVAGPGLAYLRDMYPELSALELKATLRIGEVYFAAPDIDFNSFVDRYLKFKDIVCRTTINLNRFDSVLRLAAFQNGVSRLGRPNIQDITEQEREILLEALKTSYLDVLNVGDSKALNLGGAHDSWYNHPWVSNDLLLLLLFNAAPLERGLEEYQTDFGAIGYSFPDNYVERIDRIIRSQSEGL